MFVLQNRKKIPFHYLAILTFFLIQMLASRVLIRPLIFNFLFIQFFLITLLRYEKTRDHKKLLWLVPLGALWSNLHLGCFVYGTMLIGVFLFAALIEYGNFLIDKKTFCYSKDHIKPLKDLFLVLLLFWLSMSISPYGVAALIYPWKVFVFPKFIHFYQSTAVMEEMLAPNILNPTFVLFFYPLLILIIFSFIIHGKKKLITLLLIILSLFLFLFARLGTDFASITIIYMLAATFSGRNDFNSKNFIKKLFSIYQKILFFFIIVTMIITCYVKMMTSISQNGIKEQTIFSEYETGNHQKTIKFLESLNGSNRIFCNDNLGSYLTWKLYPKSKPFVDGRQVDKHIFFEQFVPFLNNPVALWEVLDEKYNFQIVFLELRSDAYTLLANYINHHPKWQLVLIDGWDIVFAKKGSIDAKQDFSIKNINNSALSVEEKKSFQQIPTQAIPWHSKILTKQWFFSKDLAETTIFFNSGFRNYAIRRIISLNKEYANENEIKRIAELFYFVINEEQKK
jgi:hypothetical protein